MTTSLRAAWDHVWDVLPARWRVGPPSHNPDPKQAPWSVTAIRPHPGRGKMPQTVTGTGNSAAAALEDLAAAFRGEHIERERLTQLDELRRTMRHVYFKGGEEGWPGMTAEELEGVLARFPGTR